MGVDSHKLEYGFGVMYAGVPSSQAFVVGGQSYSNCLACTIYTTIVMSEIPNTAGVSYTSNILYSLYSDIGNHLGLYITPCLSDSPLRLGFPRTLAVPDGFVTTSERWPSGHHQPMLL